MTPPVVIRLANPADVSDLLRIERQATEAAHWSIEQYEALFLPGAPSRVVLVAIDDSNQSAVIGFLVASCATDEWELESVVVDVTMRHTGIGAALLQELVRRARTAHACAVILEVRESNLPARQLYEKFGFMQEHCRKDYYQGPLEPALMYRLPLQACDNIP